MSGTSPNTGSRLTSNTFSDSPRDSATSRAQDGYEAYEGTRDAFILAFNVVKDITEISGVLSPLKSVCALIIRGLETTREINNNKRAWRELAAELENQLARLDGYIDQLGDEPPLTASELKSSLAQYAECIKTALEEALQAEERSKRGFRATMKRITTIKMDPERISKLMRDIDNAYRRFSEAMDVLLYQKVNQVEKEVVKMREDIKLEFSKLSLGRVQPSEAVMRTLYGLDLDSCEEGTRTGIIDQICEWANAAEMNQQIFWLRDAAGTGKTTVAVTMSRTWFKEGRLAGRFFFTPNTRKVDGIDTIEIFNLTVAKDMAELQPSLRPIIEKVMQGTSPLHLDLEAQFDRLIVNPLRDISSPLFLVFDAVDNCEEGEEHRKRDKLMETILKYLPHMPKVRVFMTSRPLPDIRYHLDRSPLVYGHDIQLLDIHSRAKLDDIRIFVTKRLPSYTEEQREVVTVYSDGLFIWASTACKLLRSSRKPGRILERFVTEKTERLLDVLYMEVLDQALSDKDDAGLMLNVLQVIINSYEPVSIRTIEVFLPDNEHVDDYVQDLGSVLKDGEPHRPIRVLHPTFREFLSHPTRPGNFTIDPVKSHAAITIGCLNSLDQLLKFDFLDQIKAGDVYPSNADIYDLDKLLKNQLSPALQYASSYWPYHAAAAVQKQEEEVKGLRQFVERKLLNWVELMSLRDQLPGCVQGLYQLKLAFDHRTSDKDNGERKELDSQAISHAYQFLLQYQTLIQNSALHTYTSTLASTPKDSKLFQKYRTQYRNRLPIVFSDHQSGWSGATILTGHKNQIQSMEFSSDARRMVSVSRSGTWLWNPDSGASVRGLEEERQFHPNHYCFSPDGVKFVFVTFTGKLHIWNAAKGEDSRPITSISDGAPIPIAFCPTKPYIAASAPETFSSALQFVDARTGKTVGRVMKCIGTVNCVAFSPDGMTLACGGEWQWNTHGAIALWDVSNSSMVEGFSSNGVEGAIVQPLAGAVCCIAYSPTGESFVSGSNKGHLFLWNGTNGENIMYMNSGRAYTLEVFDDGKSSSPIPRHDTKITQVVYSPTGDRIASSSEDGVLMLWNDKGESICPPLKGHTAEISLVSFSPSGDRLLSVSKDQTVRLWDGFSGEVLPTIFTGFTGEFTAVAISANWKRLAIAMSEDFGIHIFDLVSNPRGKDAPTSVKHRIPVWRQNIRRHPFGFTPNGFNFISTSQKELRFWRLREEENGEITTRTLKAGEIECLAISPHSDYLITASSKKIQLWRIDTAEPIGEVNPVTKKESWVTAVGYAADGTAALGFSNGFIQLVNPFTNEIKGQVDSTEDIRSIVFSNDSQRMATLGSDKCEVWNVTSGSRLGVFHSDNAEWISPPHGDRIVTMTPDRLTVFNPKTSAFPSFTVNRASSTHSAEPPYLTEDGLFLVDGSCVWDVSAYPKQVKSEDHPPSFLQERGPFLSYYKGWIHSSQPVGPLLPVPAEWIGSESSWKVCGSKIAFSSAFGSVVVDCSRLL